MQLSPARFNGFLSRIGQDFGWRRSFACPCINPASGAPKPTCPLCSGKGVQWDAEVIGRAGMTNQTPKKQLQAFGIYEPGDATLTIGSDSPIYAAGKNDRIRALNSTNPFSMNLVQGENDRILGTVVSISRVFWLSTDGASVIEGGIPDVSVTGVLTWAAGAPPDGVTYSVSGVKYDEFFVFNDLPSDRNEHAGAQLPKKLLARKFDLFGH